VVPTRDSLTGDVTPEIEATFSKKRAASFPAWANRARFGPLMFRVAVNTRVENTQAGKFVRVGDPLHLEIPQSPANATA
jgi:hypothetical protein